MQPPSSAPSPLARSTSGTVVRTLLQPGTTHRHRRAERRLQAAAVGVRLRLPRSTRQIHTDTPTFARRGHPRVGRTLRMGPPQHHCQDVTSRLDGVRHQPNLDWPDVEPSTARLPSGPGLPCARFRFRGGTRPSRTPPIHARPYPPTLAERGGMPSGTRPGLAIGMNLPSPRPKTPRLHA